MGQCYSKQQQQSLRTTTKTPIPQKCLHLQNPPSLILQLSNNNIQTITIKPISSLTNTELTHKLQPGIFFTSNNQLLLCVEGEGLNDRRILEAVHVYYRSLGKQGKEGKEGKDGDGMVQADSAYLWREGKEGKEKEKEKVRFIVRTRSLGEGKFVDLVDLGRRMREKKICWQDLEFSDIVVQVCRKYSKVDYKEQWVKSILVSTDGSIHILTFPSQDPNPQKSLLHLQTLLLSALYGMPPTPLTSTSTTTTTSPPSTPFTIPSPYPQLQKSSQFKHPSSLSMLQSLPTTLSHQQPTKYTPITNPSVKFIRDYVLAYYYKLELYDQELVDVMVGLGFYRKAKALLEGYMVAKGVFQGWDQGSFGMFVKLLGIQVGIDPNSADTVAARNRVCTAAVQLAKSFKHKNNYQKSHYYYNQCLLHKSPTTTTTNTTNTTNTSPTTTTTNPNYKPDQQLYLQLSQICRALNKNLQAESALLEGLAQYPNSRVLGLAIIVFLCDCMRVDEAEDRLMMATSGFKTLEMQISSAKILLTKAVLDPNKRTEYLRKAQQQLSKVVVQQYQKPTTTTTNSPSSSPQQSLLATLSLYHQTVADCQLQLHNFPSSKQSYHTSKLITKNYQSLGYRLATLTAAQANCYLMQGSYDDAICLYNQAEGYIGIQCRSLRDSVVGNRGIARIRMGMVEEGVKEIQGVLGGIGKEAVGDYNYTFLRNVVNSVRQSDK